MVRFQHIDGWLRKKRGQTRRFASMGNKIPHSFVVVVVYSHQYKSQDNLFFCNPSYPSAENPKRSIYMNSNTQRTGIEDTKNMPILHQHQSYGGDALSFSCDSKSAVRRTFTISPVTPALQFGFLTLVDLLIAVFALAPYLQQLLTPVQSREETLTGAESASSSSSSLSPFFTSSLLRVLLLVFVARVVWRFATRVPAERLTVVRNVGVQLHRQSIFGTWQPVELIDVGAITSLFIHEGFLHHRCVFFLAIACQDRPRLALPFHNTMPRLPVLQAVLRGTRAVLYGEPEVGPTLSEIEAASRRTLTTLSADNDAFNVKKE